MILFLALPRWLSGKVSICNAGDAENLGSIPESDSWVGKIPWSGKWQPTPVFLAGKSHGQRSFVDPCCYKRLSDYTTAKFYFLFLIHAGMVTA